MNKKYMWVWTIWIGLASGLYCFIYSFLPIASYNVIWMTFVSLPIFFGAGAKVEELPHFFLSLISGVIWALVYLKFIGQMTSAGFSGAVAMLVAVSIVTIICVGLHMNVIGNSVFGKVPMIFGSISMVFSQGGSNLTAIVGTLTGGLLLGASITIGGVLIMKVLNKNEKVISQIVED